jgi:hypothetical protein
VPASSTAAVPCWRPRARLPGQSQDIRHDVALKGPRA